MEKKHKINVNHISLTEAMKALDLHDGQFIKLFSHGSLEIELYHPKKEDHQQPHNRDELYIVLEGHGDFILNQDKFPFQKGDAIFVPAGDVHRFVDFSDDFSTWVIFYGPEGVED
jgi:mannose-6-phosphate isomerase-like protein (cupin superfamily)